MSAIYQEDDKCATCGCTFAAHEGRGGLVCRVACYDFTPQIVIKRLEPIQFFPDAPPRPCREMPAEEIRKLYPNKH